MFHARSAYYVHETEEIYTASQLNLGKLIKEPSATYQIRLWSQKRHKGQQATHHVVTSCYVHHHSSETDMINSSSPGRLRVPEEHNERTEHTEVYSSIWTTLQQLSSSKMVVEPLLLNHNKYALSLLEELGRSNVPNAKHVAIIQSGHLLPVPGDQAPTRHDFCRVLACSSWHYL